MGRPKKIKEFEVQEKVVEDASGLKQVENKKEESKSEAVEIARQISKCAPPHLEKCQCKDLISSTQAAFEDGQTGTIIIGDASRNEIILRYIENGKEHVRMINKKR